MIKKCKKCGNEKPKSDFHFQSKAKGTKSCWCKDCHKEWKKGKHLTPSWQDARRRLVLRKSYGITVEEYNSMFEQQEGKCAICSIHQSELTRRLHVDHNHETGAIRGLLCHSCNTSLGGFKESVETLKLAISYLDKENQL